MTFLCHALAQCRHFSWFKFNGQWCHPTYEPTKDHGAVFHGSLVFEAAMESGWPRNLQAVENLAMQGNPQCSNLTRQFVGCRSPGALLLGCSISACRRSPWRQLHLGRLSILRPAAQSGGSRNFVWNRLGRSEPGWWICSCAKMLVWSCMPENLSPVTMKGNHLR